jgi:hypothetical protein
MRSILWAIAAAALVLGGSTITSAQGTGGRKAATAPYAKSAKAPRHFYRSYYRSPYKTCGQFRYWKGGKCMDARTNPPSLK